MTGIGHWHSNPSPNPPCESESEMDSTECLDLETGPKPVIGMTDILNDWPMSAQELNHVM